MKTARQSAAEIVKIFNKHWGAFRRELSENQSLKECRDKSLAWKMAMNEISRFVFEQGGKE